MTLRELTEEISLLGFDEIPYTSTHVASSAYRALRMIFSEHPVTMSYSLYKEPYTVLSRVPILRHSGGGSEVLPLSGRAYTLTPRGVGRIKVTDGADVRIYEIDSKTERISGYLKSGGTLTLEGELSYTVYDLVCFAESYSTDVRDVPNGKSVCDIELRELIPDIARICEQPRDSRGKILENVRIFGTRVELDAKFSGEVRINYCRMPRQILSDEPDAEIDIPREYEHLLPLLAASFVWLDDEPERAMHYRELYREGSDKLRKDAMRRIDTAYTHNGWA